MTPGALHRLGSVLEAAAWARELLQLTGRRRQSQVSMATPPLVIGSARPALAPWVATGLLLGVGIAAVWWGFLAITRAIRRLP